MMKTRTAMPKQRWVVDCIKALKGECASSKRASENLDQVSKSCLQIETLLLRAALARVAQIGSDVLEVKDL